MSFVGTGIYLARMLAQCQTQPAEDQLRSHLQVMLNKAQTIKAERDDLQIKLSIAQSQLDAIHTEAAMKREMAARDANPFHGMWQDAAGTIPVTAVGQPVGRMEIDGEALVQSFAANRPTAMSGGFISENKNEWLEPEK